MTKKNNRKSGILCAVSSLPGSHGVGDFGPGAKLFIDWIKLSGFNQWAILPLGPTGYGNSPYQSSSAFAGNINYISAEGLSDDGYLDIEDLKQSGLKADTVFIDYGLIFEKWTKLLKNKAYMRFFANGGQKTTEYEAFCHGQSKWLDEYGLFMAIKAASDYRPWWEWPEPLKNREKHALLNFMKTHVNDIDFWKFTQFIFFRQWRKIRAYANQNGVEIIGDMPFYIAPDSADVWSKKELFQIDTTTNCVEMWAGVPADNIKEKVRNWGNPVYQWEEHQKEGYSWFRQRVRHCGDMYDALRIDHVIAVMRYYGIRPGEKEGKWYDGPDMYANKLSDAIDEEARKAGLDIIAEDLGQVPSGLRERMKEINWSGMRVLQFAFTGKYGAKSNHLPFYHEPDMVIYTGTHDNPTIRGFLDSKNDDELCYLKWWTGTNTGESLHWAIIKEAYKSPANQVIIPIQDFLGLGEESRMVFQDNPENSWLWKLSDIKQLKGALARKIRQLAVLTGRLEVERKEFVSYLE